MSAIAARDLWRIPGLLSLARIPLGGLFVVWSSRPILAIAVLFVSAGTDVADGWYARRYGQESPTGRVLDPITDKIFVAIVVATLIGSNTLSVGEALLLGTREILEAGLLLALALRREPRRRGVRGANVLGKLATVMQFIAVGAILLGSPSRRWWVLCTALCGFCAGVGYAVRELRVRPRDNHPATG